MDHSYSRSRNKRPYYEEREERDLYSGSSRQKRHVLSPTEGRSDWDSTLILLKHHASSDTVFRILCPEAKAGCVIGMGGSIIKALRQETGAKITIADAVRGSEDRVVIISGLEHDPSRRSRDGDERESERRPSHPDTLSPAQDALLKVHARILEGATPGEEDLDLSRSVTTRLLVPNSQVGCLLGKGGRIIEQMRDETNAQIRVLPRDQLPLCSLPTDEIVQIVGEVNVVKKALHMISSRLRDNPPRDHELVYSSPASTYSPDRRGYPSEDSYFPSRSSSARHEEDNRNFHKLPPSFSHRGASNENSRHSHDAPAFVRNLPDFDRHPSSANGELVFRVLCPLDKVGSIIGKGGSIIRSLRDEIGAAIRVADAVQGSDERVVIISSIEATHPDDDLAPAQEALLHVQSRIVDLGPDEDAVITTRLLVPADQVGCLIGKGGSIIAEMRRATRANIRILGQDNLPRCAHPNDELVQIVGDIRVAREALIEVSKRLRKSLHEPSELPSGVINSSDQAESDALNPHDHGSQVNAYLPFLGLSSSGHPASDYHNFSSSPGHLGSQDRGGERTVTVPKLEISSNLPGFLLLNRSSGATIRKTTIEVVISDHAAKSLHNKPDSILQIRQMSGAKVTLLDVRPEASERVIEISGTPEQTHAAQCFLQSFIAC